MGKTLIGTMSTTGFITDDQMELAADRHLTYWFACRKNQNRLIPTNNSFEFLLSEYQGNRNTLVENFKTELTSYFLKIFDRVEVDTEVIDSEEQPGNFHLRFSMMVIHNNKAIDLLNSVEISGESYKLVKKGRGQ